MQIVFFIFFLIHYTLASDFEIIRSRDQGYPLANTPVESFLIDDSELTRPSRGDQPILTYSDTISETNPSSQDQTWIEDVGSLFMVGIAGTHCTNKNAELPSINFFRRVDSSGDHHHHHHHQHRRNYRTAKKAKHPASTQKQHMN